MLIQFRLGNFKGTANLGYHRNVVKYIVQHRSVRARTGLNLPKTASSEPLS
jgi:hypothetical protein